MNHSTRRQCLTVLLLCLSAYSFSQDLRTFNQNASRSNHTRLSVSLSPTYSTPFNNKNDSLLFRGSGSGFNMGVDYFFDKIGIGFITGFGSSSTDDATINNFIKRSNTLIDLPVITTSKQQSMYLLLGPTIRVGTTVALEAHAKGGLFINNGGIVNIQQRGAQKPGYRNEPTDKAINPGFLTGLKVKYSTKSATWSYGLGIDYMSTKVDVNNYDVRRGNGIEPLKLSRTIKDLVAGLTITYNIPGSRDQASGQSAGKRTRPRDIASGSPTGTRMVSVNNDRPPRDVASGLPTGRRMAEPGSCGPVTQTTTSPDGIIEQLSFACAEDAAAYQERRGITTISNEPGNRLSMNVTVAKQTQGANFGEKVNAGLHAAGSALAQGAAKNGIIKNENTTGNVIAGKISWADGTDLAGITTNKTTTARQTPNTSFGARIMFGTREPASGKTAGVKKYGLLFADQGASKTNNNTSGVTGNPLYSSIAVSDNPLYEGQTGTMTNPLFETEMMMGSSPGTENKDPNCSGISDINVLLVDAVNGSVMAKTKTENCGDFFFANVPDGDYIVKLSGAINITRGYDVHTNTTIDLAGVATQPDQQLRLQLFTEYSGDEKVVRSGSKAVQLYGIESTTSQPVALVAGNPIGGIIVKGGKNPGGSFRQTATNNNGEFSFDHLDAGDYTFKLQQTMLLDDESVVSVSDPAALNSEGNPLYNGSGSTGNNPIYNPSARTASSGVRTYTGGRRTEAAGNPAARTESGGRTYTGGRRTEAAGNPAARTESGGRTYTGGRRTESITVITEQEIPEPPMPDNIPARKLKGKVIRMGDNGMNMVNAGEPITFAWDQQAGETVYQLLVWQLVAGQTANEAMIRNVPIIEKQVSGSAVTISAAEIGPCKPPYLCDFIWSVQAVSKAVDKYESQFRIVPAKANNGVSTK